MLRTVLGLSLVAVLFAASGCSMCRHPYDCSGPVYDNDGCQGCSSGGHGRAGSILDGDGSDGNVQTSTKPSPKETNLIEELSTSSVRTRPKTRSQTVSMPSAKKTPVDAASASAMRTRPKTRGQSVSFDTIDGRVQARVKGKVQTGDVPGSEKIVSVTDRVVKPAAESAQVAEDAPSEPFKPLATDAGWTARRPTSEVLR
jgi:hypothetical protein